MRRRDFVGLLGGAVAWPLGTRAQPNEKLIVIGYLSARSPDDTAHLVEAFRSGLNENGFVELGITIELFSAAEESSLDPAFSAMSRQNVQALIIANDPFLLGHRTTLVQSAGRGGIPTLYFSRDFVEAGGLMSYGSNIGEGYYNAGLYTGHHFEGCSAFRLTCPAANEVRISRQYEDSKISESDSLSFAPRPRR
jgi:hypothetical protein